MNTEFPRILTLLRKERNISQKKAAIDLGVSQGLLSHYEKGKRECGLSFLVKAADYYNVSCDYLLGRTAQQQGVTITVDELPEYDPASKEGKIAAGSMMVSFYKKLVINSLEVLFGILSKCRSQVLINQVGSYLMTAVYKMFRKLYKANDRNDENFFKVNDNTWSACASAVMQISEGKIDREINDIDNSDCVEISNQSLSEQYQPYYLSLVNLIKNTEAKVTILSNADK